jgi:hypothetical protein
MVGRVALEIQGDPGIGTIHSGHPMKKPCIAGLFHGVAPPTLHPVIIEYVLD